jgi:hypothetical protein
MPFYETIDQQLPIGLFHKDTWYNVAVVREQSGGDMKHVSSPEARNNFVKGITNFLSDAILQFKNTETGDTLDRVTKEIVQSMFIADRDQCLLASRKLSYGDDVSITFRCTNQDCRETITFDYDLSQVETKFSEEFPPNLETVVELDRGAQPGPGPEFYKTFILTHLRGRDQEKMSQMSKENPARSANYTLFTAIKDIPGYEFSRRTPALVENLRIKDTNILFNAFSDMQLGPKLEADVVCGSCDTETKLPLVQKMLSFSE